MLVLACAFDFLLSLHVTGEVVAIVVVTAAAAAAAAAAAEVEEELGGAVVADVVGIVGFRIVITNAQHVSLRPICVVCRVQP